MSFIVRDGAFYLGGRQPSGVATDTAEQQAIGPRAWTLEERLAEEFESREAALEAIGELGSFSLFELVPVFRVSYRRIHHAAHTGRGAGWDLEEWTAQVDRRDPRPAEIPADAKYHSGFLRDGVQHSVYVRRAPLGEGPCSQCERGPWARGAA